MVRQSAGNCRELPGTADNSVFGGEECSISGQPLGEIWLHRTSGRRLAFELRGKRVVSLDVV